MLIPLHVVWYIRRPPMIYTPLILRVSPIPSTSPNHFNCCRRYCPVLLLMKYSNGSTTLSPCIPEFAPFSHFANILTGYIQCTMWEGTTKTLLSSGHWSDYGRLSSEVHGTMNYAIGRESASRRWRRLHIAATWSAAGLPLYILVPQSSGALGRPSDNNIL